MKERKFNIRGFEWVVRFIHTTDLPDDTLGRTLSHKQIIEIDDSLTETETRNVVTHEVVHAYLALAGRNFEDNVSNESICEFFVWNMAEIAKTRDEILEWRKGWING